MKNNQTDFDMYLKKYHNSLIMSGYISEDVRLKEEQ